MKKLTKKYLMLLAVIVAIMSLSVFAASAADCDHTLYPSYEGDVIAPTCTTEGYTEVVCGKCDTAIGRVPGSTTPATGHKFKWTMTVDGDHFYNAGECGTCRAVVREKDDNNKDVIYYSVSFYNPAAAESYDTGITYTKVVSTRKGFDSAELLDVIYVKAGEKAELPATLAPTCEKDKDYGKYNFIGWYDSYVLIEAAPVAATADPYNFGDLAITANLKVYAGFQGEDVSHDVRYYDFNGKYLAIAKAVPYGKAAIYNLETPTKESDVKYRYTFAYWGDQYDDEVDLTAVYGDVSVNANYLAIERTYNLEYYYDAACTKPIINEEVKVTDSEVKYGHAATNGLAIPKSLLVKEADDQYVYEWTGRWVLANRQYYTVSLDAISVPDGTPDSLDGSSAVRLIPQYVKSNRVYDFKVTVIYPDDGNYHPEDVSIQVLYANGTAAGYQKATQINEFTYEYTFVVNYSDYYTVSASATGYLGEVTSHFFNGPSGAIVQMEKVAAYSCGCICHTFLKPIWVRVLRLLHTLFGLEHVCCSDMFANIGADLNYGPGK